MVVPAESLAGVAAELTAEGALVVMVMLAPLLAAQVVKLVEQLVKVEQVVQAGGEPTAAAPAAA